MTGLAPQLQGRQGDVVATWRPHNGSGAVALNGFPSGSAQLRDKQAARCFDERHGNLNGLSMNRQVVDHTETNQPNLSSKIKTLSGLKSLYVSKAARKRHFRVPNYANQIGSAPQENRVRTAMGLCTNNAPLCKISTVLSRS